MYAYGMIQANWKLLKSMIRWKPHFERETIMSTRVRLA